MKVAIKNKSEIKYIDSKDISVDGISLLELYNKVNKQDEIIANLMNRLKESHIVRKDTEYIIKLENELKHIDKLEIVEVQELKYPLRFYDLNDGVLELNKKKVVVL